MRLGLWQQDEIFYTISEILNDDIYEWKKVFYSTEKNYKMLNYLGGFFSIKL